MFVSFFCDPVDVSNLRVESSAFGFKFKAASALDPSFEFLVKGEKPRVELEREPGDFALDGQLSAASAQHRFERCVDEDVGADLKVGAFLGGHYWSPIRQPLQMFAPLNASAMLRFVPQLRQLLESWEEAELFSVFTWSTASSLSLPPPREEGEEGEEAVFGSPGLPPGRKREEAGGRGGSESLGLCVTVPKLLSGCANPCA